MNSVNLIGRLCKEVDLRKTQNGKSVVQFTLAVNRIAKTQGQPDADFINCVAWNRLADLMCQYLHRGSLIGVEGRIQTRNYENNQGQRVYVTEVVADNVQFLEPKNTQHAQSNAYGANTYAQPQAAMDPYGQAASSMPAAQDPFGADFDANDTLDISSDDLPF